MSKRSSLAVTLIGVGIILAALCLVLSALMAPRTAAKKALGVCRRTLAETSEFSYLTVFSPLDHSGPLLPTDAEVRLTDSGEIDAVRDRLLSFLEEARYGGVEEATGGNWDIRVRFAAGETVQDIYLSEDTLYLSRGERRYVFLPRDAEEYAAWRTEFLTLLFGTAE